MANLAMLQRDHEVSLAYGHRVYERVGTANSHIGQAIEAIIVAHKALDRLGRNMGVEPTAYGDTQPKPPAPEGDGFFGGA